MDHPAPLTIWIKPLGGIAGDMFAGACAALWPDRAAQCLSDVRAAGLPLGVAAGFEPATVNGFAATAFRVAEAGPIVPGGAYPAITQALAASALDGGVKRIALEIFRILGEAEAAVHGKPLSAVHFHELSGWDAVADITAAASFIAAAEAAGGAAAEAAGGVAWRVDPLPLGGGTVSTAHGRVTAPAPATLRILEGYAFIDDGQSGERVTPTGAAILRYLTAGGDPAPTPAPAGRLVGSGFGAGSKRFEGIANVTQLLAFEQAAAPGLSDRRLTEIAFDIDDMTAEELALAVERLRAEPGVLEITQTPQIGKKGRAAVLVRILIDPAAEAPVIARCFAETASLGLRLTDLRRIALPRAAVATQHGRVKRAERPGGAATAKVESDDLSGGPDLASRRAQAQRAEAAALARRKAEADDEP